MSLVKLYDGLIVKTPEFDPQEEFRYDNAGEYQSQIEKEIFDLQVIVARFSSGKEEDGKQMWVTREPHDAFDISMIIEYNRRIGYSGAVNELNEKVALLECLRGEITI